MGSKMYTELEIIDRRKSQLEKYRNSDKGIATYNAYMSSEKRKLAISIYNAKPSSKLKRIAYEKSDKGYARQKKWRDSMRLKVLEYYSKELSNSTIPCCNCCGENNHIDFLAVDHIDGKKKMDSIKELVDIGYSSKMSPHRVVSWIYKNSYPKGFQILCSNCNFAKGMVKNKNTCPHQHGDMK